jgi:hypothetical protein
MGKLEQILSRVVAGNVLSPATRLPFAKSPSLLAGTAVKAAAVKD